MKQKTKKTKKIDFPKTSFKIGSREDLIFASVPYTLEDFKNSILIVSVLVNAFVLITWITIQSSPVHAAEFAQIIVG